MSRAAVMVALLITAFFLTTLYALAVETSGDSHRLNSSDEAKYLEHGEAMYLLNNCGKDIFIPSKTSAEWESFNASPPSCISKDNDFIECVSSATGNDCTGSLIASMWTGTGTWAECKTWAEGTSYGTGSNDGTCLRALGGMGMDNQCELYDGAPTGTSIYSGACTDYD